MSNIKPVSYLGDKYEAVMTELFGETKAFIDEEQHGRWVFLANRLDKLKKQITSCPDKRIMESMPLAEGLGAYTRYLDERRTGPGVALAFLRFASEVVNNPEHETQIVASWEHILGTLTFLDPRLARDELDVAVDSRSKCLKSRAELNIVPVAENMAKVYGEDACKDLAWLSCQAFGRKDRNLAGACALLWMRVIEKKALEDHVDAVQLAIETGCTSDNDSPMEHAWATFVLSFHCKTVRQDPVVAKEALEAIKVYTKPQGAFAAEADKKLQIMDDPRDGGCERKERNGGSNWRHRFDDYDFV